LLAVPAIRYLRETPPPGPGLAPGPAAVMRFQIPLPEKTALLNASAFALSPDGRQLAFAASGPDGVPRLWVRALDSLEARPLPGTESRNLIGLFFWSPDSRSIAFDAVGKLKKALVAGDSVETICDLNPREIVVGGSWSRDGVIIFGQSQGGLMQVPAAGGTASPLTAVDRSRGEYHHVMPWFLPDGRHFIYSRQGTAEVNGLYVGSLGAKQGQVAKRLITTQSAMVAYALTTASEGGRLFFVRDGVLLTQSFDPVRLELRGEPTPLAENLALFLDSAAFHLSANGILVYRVGGGESFQPTWYDRKGKFLGATGEEHAGVSAVRLSPDGKWAAVTAGSSDTTSTVAIWLLDFARGTSTRFTFGSSKSRMPVWSPDGSRIIFASDRGGHYDLYQKPTNGGSDEQLLFKSDQDKYPSSWSQDGRFVLYTVVDPKAGSDQWILPLEGNRKPFPFPHTGLTEGSGQFSPDGRWVAYMSDESGRPEVYVRSFLADSSDPYSGGGGKWLISDGGGFFPQWRADGKELYYNDARSRMVAVDVSANPGFKVGVPELLFPTPIENPLGLPGQWDVTSDGERFLISAQSSQSTHAPFTVVSNWPALLTR